MCIEEFSEEQFIEAVKAIVKKDIAFLPQEKGQSLYIRPVVFGDGNFLGVHSSPSFKFIIMTSPVASYYESGLAPVKILVTHEYARTVEGGLGMAKTAANYAASLYAGRMAKQQGYQQVLWLDGRERKFIDEVGAMNIFFVIDGELVTPTLENGTILPGVTRDTVIQLGKEWGMNVREERISIDEIWDAHKSGKLNEVFGTGTAATISPVGLLSYKGESITINNGEIGQVSNRLYETITGIQHGLIEDTHSWNIHLDI
jgi:branched-chain amino acid aminotransferase